jgi:4-oxalocrotonate tautomerase
VPFVHVHWYEGRTPEQKAEIARRITEALVEEGNTTADQVWIHFDDSEPGDWAMRGELQD